MFGFPVDSEIKKIVAKDALLGRVGLLAPASTSQKATFNKDIAQVVITNVVSTKNLPVAAGARVKGFYVARVTMKRKQFNPKNVETLLHRIGQKNILLALVYGDVVRFALKYDEHFVVSKDWVLAEEFCFVFSGLNLDDVWNGIEKQEAGGTWNEASSVAENVDIQEHIAKLQKEIANLEKKARIENQPARKLELFNLMKAKVAELAACKVTEPAEVPQPASTSLRAEGEAIHPECHPEQSA